MKNAQIIISFDTERAIYIANGLVHPTGMHIVQDKETGMQKKFRRLADRRGNKHPSSQIQVLDRPKDIGLLSNSHYVPRRESYGSDRDADFLRCAEYFKLKFSSGSFVSRNMIYDVQMSLADEVSIKFLVPTKNRHGCIYKCDDHIEVCDDPHVVCVVVDNTDYERMTKDDPDAFIKLKRTARLTYLHCARLACMSVPVHICEYNSQNSTLIYKGDLTSKEARSNYSDYPHFEIALYALHWYANNSHHSDATDNVKKMINKFAAAFPL